MDKTCAGETNASHPYKHQPKHRYQPTPRNCYPKLIAAIKTQIVLKTAKNDVFLWKKLGLKTASGDFLGMYELIFLGSSIFHLLWTHIGHFKGKKMQLIFFPILALF